MSETSPDNVRNQRQQSKNSKGEKSYNSSPKWRAIVDHQSKFLEHHNVDKGLAVRCVQVWDSVSLLLSVTLCDVDLSDFVFLILKSVLNFPKLSFLFTLDELLFSFGRQVISKAHSQSIANEDWNSDGKNVSGFSSRSDTSQDDSHCIDNTVESTVHRRLEVFTCLNVLFFVRIGIVDSVCAEERLFLGGLHCLVLLWFLFKIY